MQIGFRAEHLSSSRDLSSRAGARVICADGGAYNSVMIPLEEEDEE